MQGVRCGSRERCMKSPPEHDTPFFHLTYAHLTEHPIEWAVPQTGTRSVAATRCSSSMLPNVSINGRIRSSGQFGRW